MPAYWYCLLDWALAGSTITLDARKNTLFIHFWPLLAFKKDMRNQIYLDGWWGTIVCEVYKTALFNKFWLPNEYKLVGNENLRAKLLIASP